MNNSISFKEILKKGAVLYNPVLVQLVGLCPVIAASTTFLQAAMLSAAMCVELIATSVIASAFFKRLPRWIRMPLYLLIGLAIVCPVLYYLETYSLSAISLGMKIYLPLTAINSVVAVHCEQVAIKSDMKLAFYDALASGIGISAIFLVTGAVREILGRATFAGVEVNVPVTFKGMTLPFGCLILLGFLAAGLKAVSAKLNPVQIEEEKEEVENVPEPEKVTVEEKAKEKAEAEKLKEEVSKLREQEMEKARSQALRVVESAKREAYTLLQELEKLKKEQQKTKDAAELARRAKAMVRKGVDAIDSAADPVIGIDDDDGNYVLPRTLVAGDTVIIRDIGKTAKVLSPADKNGNVEVQAGSIKTRVKLANLRLCENAPKKKEKKSTKNTIGSPGIFQRPTRIFNPSFFNACSRHAEHKLSHSINKGFSFPTQKSGPIKNNLSPMTSCKVFARVDNTV